MHEIRWTRILHILLLIAIIFSGYIFSETKGLVLKGNNKDIYVTELLSTGSDDNITVEFSTILFIPAIVVSLLRLKKNMNLIEYLFNSTLILLQILFLISIEGGSMFNTMAYNHNKALWIWVISFVIFICFLQLFFFCKNNCQKGRVSTNGGAQGKLGRRGS